MSLDRPASLSLSQPLPSFFCLLFSFSFFFFCWKRCTDMCEWQSRSMKNRDTGATIHTFVNAWKAWQQDMKAPKHIDNWRGMWLLKPSPRRGEGLQPSQHIKVNREFLEMLGSIFFQVCIGWGRGQHIAQQAKPSTHKMCVSLLLGRSCPDSYIFQPCQFPAGFPVPKNSECEDKDRWNAWQRHNHTRLPNSQT